MYWNWENWRRETLREEELQDYETHQFTHYDTYLCLWNIGSLRRVARNWCPSARADSDGLGERTLKDIHDLLTWGWLCQGLRPYQFVHSTRESADMGNNLTDTWIPSIGLRLTSYDPRAREEGKSPVNTSSWVLATFQKILEMIAHTPEETKEGELREKSESRRPDLRWRLESLDHLQPDHALRSWDEGRRSHQESKCTDSD